jgi:hypothetical protein
MIAITDLSQARLIALKELAPVTQDLAAFALARKTSKTCASPFPPDSQPSLVCVSVDYTPPGRNCETGKQPHRAGVRLRPKSSGYVREQETLPPLVAADCRCFLMPDS